MDEMAELLQLKPCPFCGEIPRVRMIEQERFGGKRLVLECCMTHEITQAAPETIISWGGEKEYIETDITPEEKWNRRTNTEGNGEKECEE